MIKSTNLANRITQQLPAELVDFMHLAGEAASRSGQKLFLVGGVVRDLLLQRSNLDLDLVIEGNAITLAEELAKARNGKVIAHSRFNTAKIKWDRWSVDIATARSESYEKPGALPSFDGQCDLQSDLARRDFTINAMAIDLSPEHYGDLIDLYQGRQDLEHRLIRILHDNSFRDDSTRIWRAVRYEQRLGFRIEPHTLELLQRDIEYLDTISGDRIRHELELCLEEECPEKVLIRANELGVLARLCPALKADEWVAKRIIRTRHKLQPYCPPADLYLAFLIYHLSLTDLEDLINYLKFPRNVAQVLQDTLKLKKELHLLAEAGLSSSTIYHILQPFSQDAILANMLANDTPLIQQRIELFLNTLRHVQLQLTGDELVHMGVPFGHRISELLDALKDARLDGRVTTREEELELVDKLIKAGT